MGKAILIATLVSTTVLLAECTPKKTTTTSMSAENTAKVEEIRRNYTQAQMDEGRTIFQSSCNKCHRLHEPAEHNIDKWEKVLPSMFQRAKLSEADAGKVHAYLIANAKS
jgi:cytochrome c5